MSYSLNPDLEEFHSVYNRLQERDDLVSYQLTVTVNARRLKWGIAKAWKKLLPTVLSIYDRKYNWYRDWRGKKQIKGQDGYNIIPPVAVIFVHESHLSGHPHLHMLVYYEDGRDESPFHLSCLQTEVGNTVMKKNKAYAKKKDGKYASYFEYMLKDYKVPPKGIFQLHLPLIDGKTVLAGIYQPEEPTSYANGDLLWCIKDRLG